MPEEGKKQGRSEKASRWPTAVKLIAFVIIAALPFLVYRIGSSSRQVVPEVKRKPYPATVQAQFVRAVDGDTLAVTIGGEEERVQLLGVDAGELFRKVSKTERDRLTTEWEATDDPAAHESQQRLQELLSGRTLTLEFEGQQVDRYGRLLAYVWLEDGDEGEPLFVNEWMLREGLAEPYWLGDRKKYAERLRAAYGAEESDPAADSE
ncbi:thermonuclease family protein [bacterium]|nr:thermonuclease family protein [bacterium]